MFCGDAVFLCGWTHPFAAALEILAFSERGTQVQDQQSKSAVMPKNRPTADSQTQEGASFLLTEATTSLESEQKQTLN